MLVATIKLALIIFGWLPLFVDWLALCNVVEPIKVATPALLLAAQPKMELKSISRNAGHTNLFALAKPA